MTHNEKHPEPLHPDSLAEVFPPRAVTGDPRLAFYEMGYAAAMAEVAHSKNSKKPVWVRSRPWMPLAASVLVASTLAFFVGRDSVPRSPEIARVALEPNQNVLSVDDPQIVENDSTAKAVPPLQEPPPMNEQRTASASGASERLWFDWSTLIRTSQQDLNSIAFGGGLELASHGWRPVQETTTDPSLGFSPSLRASDRFDADGSLMN